MATRKTTTPRASTAAALAQLDAFLTRFDPDVAATARATMGWLRTLAPGSVELIYDAYNALSIPFSASDQLKDAFAAVVVYPKHVNLAFNRGAELDDPKGLLQGDGKLIRHLRATPAIVTDVDVIRLVRAAAKKAGLDSSIERRVIVKAIYERQRARKPARKPG